MVDYEREKYGREEPVVVEIELEISWHAISGTPHFNTMIF